MDKNGIGILIILALLVIGSFWVMAHPFEEEEEEEEGEETVETETSFEDEVVLGAYVDTIPLSISMNANIFGSPQQTNSCW